MLRVSARVGAIWQMGDELEARDERLVVLGELIGKLTVVVRSREWESRERESREWESREWDIRDWGSRGSDWHCNRPKRNCGGGRGHARAC